MTHALEFVALLGASAVGVFAVSKLVIGVYRGAKRIESTYDLVNRELRPNGGSSLHDAIKRIDSRVQVLEALDRRKDGA